MEEKKIIVNNICCIGAGYVGGPTMSVIADRCPNINVEVVDLNESRIDAWNSEELSNLPIFEPGLDQVIKRTRGRNLFFSTNISEAIAKADMVFISVNTPTKKKGLGAGQASDLKWIEACARQVAKFSKGKTVVVEKSTLPVRTAEVIKKILGSYQIINENNEKEFCVLSNPEFLAEGTAIDNLENPDRVLIGGDDENSIKSLVNIYTNWIPEKKIITTNLWSSELSKLAANAFLAQRISSINSIAAFCEVAGADIEEVSKAIGSDSRIGSNFLNASPGFGGSCFKKDILNLVYLSRYFGLPEVADYWESVVRINEWNQKRISELIVKTLFGTISGKKIVILGFSFKANTNDTRESPAIRISKDLLEEGAKVVIYDPKVKSSQIINDLEPYSSTENCLSTQPHKNFIDGTWCFSEHLEDSFDGADAVVVLTEWPNFATIKWSSIANRMRSPGWVFDSRRIVNEKDVLSSGLNYWSIGRKYN